MKMSGQTVTQARGKNTSQLVGQPASLRALAIYLCVGVVGLALVLIASGVSARTAAAVSTTVAAQILTGGIAWLLLSRRPRISMSEFVGMGLALGTLGAVVFVQLLRGTPVAGVSWLIPTIIVGVAFGVCWWRNRPQLIDRLARLSTSEVVCVGAGIALGIFLLAPFWIAQPLSWDGWWAYYVDMPFQESLSRSVGLYGGSNNLSNAGEALRYHWLSQAWVSSLTNIVGAEPFVVLTRALPLATLVGTCSLVYAWTRRLTRLTWAPLVAITLVVGGGFVGATTTITILTWASPSQLFGTVCLLALAVMFFEYVKRDATWLALPALALLAFGCIGGKSSIGMVLVGAVGLLTVMSTFWIQQFRARIWVGGFATAVGLGTGYVLLLSGATGGLSISTVPMAAGVLGFGTPTTAIASALSAILLVLSTTAGWAGFGLFLRDSPFKRAVWYFGLGSAVVGILGLLLLTQPGASQLYITLAASTVIYVISAVAVTQSAAQAPPAIPPWAYWMAFSVGIVVQAAAFFAQIASPGTGVAKLSPIVIWLTAIVCALAILRIRRIRLTRSSLCTMWTVAACALLTSSVSATVAASGSALVTGPAKMTAQTPSAITRSHIDAAQWLAGENKGESIVATNRFCDVVTQQPPDCKSTYFMVSAYSGQQMLIEGYTYGPGLFGLKGEPLARVMLSKGFADNPDAANSAALWATGVRYMWVDLTASQRRAWKPYADVIYRSEYVWILKLRPPSAGR